MPRESEFLSNPFSLLLVICIIVGIILMGSGIIRLPILGFEYWLGITIALVAGGLIVLWKFKRAEDARKKSRTIFDLKYGTSGLPKLDPQVMWQLEDQLEELREELDRGLITQEEYDERKRELLDKYA